jgi:hypothetical protein
MGEVYRADDLELRRRLDGGEAVRVTNFSDLIIIRFAQSPDGKSLLLCRGTRIRDAFHDHRVQVS